jgi:acetyl esterase/lipase
MVRSLAASAGRWLLAPLCVAVLGSPSLEAQPSLGRALVEKDPSILGYDLPLPASDGGFASRRDYMPHDPSTDQLAFYEANKPPTFAGVSHTWVHYWPPYKEGASPQIWGGDPHPAFVFVKGGGFFSGDATSNFQQHLTDLEIGPNYRALQQAGYAVFALDYNLSIYDDQGVLHTGMARQIEQVKRAVQFLRFNAAHYNIDPDRILIGGTSAGGTIALHAALGSDLQNPNGQGYEVLSSRANRAFTGYGTGFWEDPSQPGGWTKCLDASDFILGPHFGDCSPNDPGQPVSNTNPCTFAGLDGALPHTQNKLDRIDLVRVITNLNIDYAAAGLDKLLIIHSPYAPGASGVFPVSLNHSPLFSDAVELALLGNGTLPYVRVDEIINPCNGPPYIPAIDAALGVQALCHVGFDPGPCPDWPSNCSKLYLDAVPCD